MPTGEFKNNPLYTDITKLDHLSPSPNFTYNWNKASGRWEPAGGMKIENLNVEELNIDLTSTNSILQGIARNVSDIEGLIPSISGELSVSNSQGIEAHRLLSGISGELSSLETEDVETHRLLSGISGELSNIHVDVELDNDTEAHRLLSGISGELSSLETEDVETHRLLSGISGELSNIHVDVELDNDTEAHRLLSGISGELSSLDTEDVETHRLLSGISGEFSNFGTDDTETHRLLSGISGELSGLEVEDAEAHRLLSGISGELSNLDADDTETHRLLSGISGELSKIHVDVEIDNDTEAHSLLSGIIRKLDKIGSNISITGSDINISRVKTQPWKLRTKTVSQKIEEDFLLMEDIPDSLRFGSISGDCLGLDRTVKEDIFGSYFQNGRTNISEPEKDHPDYFIHSEHTDPNRCRDSFSTFDSDTLFGMRQENFGASLINSYELEDYNDLYKRGLVDHVIMYNDSPYPIQFHTSDRRANQGEEVCPDPKDLIFLDSDMGVKINNDEAGRIFVKRPHTISGFLIKYSIVYKVPVDDDEIKG